MSRPFFLLLPHILKLFFFWGFKFSHSNFTLLVVLHPQKNFRSSCWCSLNKIKYSSMLVFSSKLNLNVNETNNNSNTQKNILYNDEKASASLKQLLQNGKPHSHTKFPFYFGCWLRKEREEWRKFVVVLLKSYTSLVRVAESSKHFICSVSWV